MSAFPSTYHEARERFVAGAEQAGLRGVRFRLPHEASPELFLDFAFVKRNPEKLLIQLSGTHGVEGYFGSAVQSAILAEPLPSTDASLLFIHAVNPYGMLLSRRANAENVDLNRNFEPKRQPNPDYARFNSFLNPRRRLGLLTGKISALYWRTRFGRARTVQAVAGGQYDFPRGLFFIGDSVQRELLLIRNLLRSHFSEAREVIAIDLHTGLGARGGEMLFVDEDVDPRAVELFTRIFQTQLAVNDPARGNYANQGRLSHALRASLPEAEWHCVVQELGTYPFPRVLDALRRENFEWHAHGPVAGATEATQALMREIFCPADPEWRAHALELGVRRWREAAAYFRPSSTNAST